MPYAIFGLTTFWTVVLFVVLMACVYLYEYLFLPKEDEPRGVSVRYSRPWTIASGRRARAGDEHRNSLGPALIVAAVVLAGGAVATALIVSNSDNGGSGGTEQSSGSPSLDEICIQNFQSGGTLCGLDALHYCDDHAGALNATSASTCDRVREQIGQIGK